MTRPSPTSIAPSSIRLRCGIQCEGPGPYNRGEYDEVIKDCNRAIALDPDEALSDDYRRVSWSDKGSSTPPSSTSTSISALNKKKKRIDSGMLMAGAITRRRESFG